MRYTRISGKRKQVFLELLKNTGNVTQACRALGISRKGIYQHRESDPSFALAWDEAVDEAVDLLEQEARRRAVDGVTREKGIYFQGVQVATEIITEYSDTLLIFLLRGHRPEKYRERYEVNVIDRVRQMAPEYGLDPEEAVKAVEEILAYKKDYPQTRRSR